jgi:hypothetical protein
MGRNTEKREKMRNTHCSTWILERKLKKLGK